jgi:hypothetical protein
MDDLDIAAMYGNTDTTPEQPVRAPGEASVPPRGIMNLPALSAEVRRLTRELEDQARTVRRLLSRLNHLESVVRQQRSTIHEMARDLDNKIDLRD